MSDNPDKCHMKGLEGLEESSSRPTVAELTELLDSLVEWEKFGLYLLPSDLVHILKKIERDHSGTDNRKRALFDEWLRVDPTASWDKVITALHKAGEYTLATTVASKKYISTEVLQKQSTDLVVTSTVAVNDTLVPHSTNLAYTLDSTSSMKSDIKTLHNDFTILVEKAQHNLAIIVNDDPGLLKRITGHAVEYVKINKVINPTDVIELFKELRPHYDFLNCELIESIIERFLNGHQVHTDLTQYVQRVEEFLKSQTLLDLKTALQTGLIPIQEGTDTTCRVVIKLTGMWGTILFKIFQRVVEYIIGKELFTHIKIEPGSVVVSFLAPETQLHLLVDRASLKIEFTNRIGIIDMYIIDSCDDTYHIIQSPIDEHSVNYNQSLLDAAEGGHDFDISILLKLGADINYQTDNEGFTALMFASESGHYQVVELLLKEHADVNIQTQDRMTALMFASVCGHYQVVELLLKKHADVNIQTQDGVTALMLASKNDHNQIMKLLLNRAEKIIKVYPMPTVDPRNDCIAAIDIGTSSLSVAYTTPFYKGDIKVLQLYRSYERVPNAILMQQKEDKPHNVRVLSIGYVAQESYSKLGTRKRQGYIYFERIKSLLERDMSVNWETVVESSTGGYYYLMEVIAFIIQHLKEMLMTHLEAQRLRCTDFEWVITVPAIWKARARRMMREAAYLAGLTCDNGGITKFTDTSRKRRLPRPLEVNPHKLTLALEPEAAAIYAHSFSSRHLPPSYMVVDIGGGTVDITVHNRRADKVDVILSPIGNVWGGNTVNQALSLMLEEFVGDKGHEAFIDNFKEKAKVALNHIYYQEFEQEKKIFGNKYRKSGSTTSSCSDEAAIRLPRSFIDFYGDFKLSKEAEQQGLTFGEGEGVLYIEYDILEKKTFQFTIDRIIDCIRGAMERLTSKVDTIYLVGGFGGCQLVKMKIEEVLIKHHSKAYDQIVCPQQADLAVCIGAVMWRQNPDIIQSRIADATYGIEVSPVFNPRIHDSHYLYTDEDGIQCCKNILKLFVLRGEVIESNEVCKAYIHPEHQRDTMITIPIYSTTDDGVQYTVDKDGKQTVQKIGELHINIPNPDNVPRLKRDVEVLMDFSGTEIKATAMYTITKEEVKTVCDFLSYHDYY